MLVGPDEHRVNNEVIRTLAADGELYQRGGRLVRVVPKGGTGPKEDGVIIQEVEPPTVREIITRRAHLVKEVKGELKTVHPPAWMVAAVHARHHWPGARPLHAVSESPVLRADGSVLETPGYDPATRILYRPAGEFPRIAEGVNLDDAAAAAEALLEVVEDYRFESDAHRSAWLAQVAAVIALGRTVSVTTYSQDVEEMRKQLTTTAVSGEPFVLFDNLSGVLGNDAIDRALTGTEWRDRLLGGNSSVSVPLVPTWAATGNNTAIEADTARRTIQIRILADTERPEDRDDFHPRDLLGCPTGNPRGPG